MRRLIVLACLSVAALTWFGLPSAAAATPPATMNGENFFGHGGPATFNCSTTGGQFSFTSSGDAVGPYPGTYTETGTVTISAFQVTGFSADFTIYSALGDVLIKGTKQLDTAVQNNSLGCLGDQSAPNAAFAFAVPTTYQATLLTATGNYRDQGVSDIPVLVKDPNGTTLLEGFLSSLAEPVLIVPTNKDQCKNGGWKNYPQFKNQGDCVSFVASGK
jgi:hypothetical protein